MTQTHSNGNLTNGTQGTAGGRRFFRWCAQRTRLSKDNTEMDVEGDCTSNAPSLAHHFLFLFFTPETSVSPCRHPNLHDREARIRQGWQESLPDAFSIFGCELLRVVFVTRRGQRSTCERGPLMNSWSPCGRASSSQKTERAASAGAYQLFTPVCPELFANAEFSGVAKIAGLAEQGQVVFFELPAWQ